MIYFGIPLISRATAADWDLVTRLLSATLASVFNSTDDRFRVIVACHEVPEIPVAFRDRVQFLQLETPPPAPGGGRPGRFERRRDRTLKRMRIAQHVRRCDPGYLMFLDADDLVDDELVRHVHERAADNGYIVKRGYRFDATTNRLWLVTDFDRVCGSCAIFRFTADDLPKDDADNDCYYRRFKEHRSWETTAASYGRPLEPIEYPAVVYVRTSGASTFRRSRLHILSSKGIRRILRRKRQQLFGRVEVSRELARRFQLRVDATAGG